MSNVSELMIKDKIPCTPTTRLEEIERLMHEEKCREVSIVDSLYENRLIGIITDDDIKDRERIEGVELSHLNAEHCMTMMPIAVSPDSSLADCVRLMDINQIERMPVVDGLGNYCGVINRQTIVNSGQLNGSSF